MLDQTIKELSKLNIFENNMENKIIKKLEKGRNPILIILVGESGVGKTTFVKKMKCENNWFESSRALVNEINISGLKKDHNNIHLLAIKKYNENPYWQVPQILKELNLKKFLILDGPRRFQEVEKLLNENYRTIIIKIKVLKEIERSNRLIQRDDIDKKDFEKISNDELKETELEKIFALADFEIINNGDIRKFEKIALKIKRIITKYLK